MDSFEPRRRQQRERLRIAPSRSQILTGRKGTWVCAGYGDFKMLVAVIDEDRRKPSNERGSKHHVVWNFISGHVVHLDLQSAGRRRHYDGLLRAGGQMQLNCVLCVPGRGLLNDGRRIQAVIPVKIHEVISDLEMII